MRPLAMSENWLFGVPASADPGRVNAELRTIPMRSSTFAHVVPQAWNLAGSSDAPRMICLPAAIHTVRSLRVSGLASSLSNAMMPVAYAVESEDNLDNSWGTGAANLPRRFYRGGLWLP